MVQRGFGSMGYIRNSFIIGDLRILRLAYWGWCEENEMKVIRKMPRKPVLRI